MKSGGHLKGLQGMGSVFGVATRIEGTVRIEESVRIDGKIEGNLDQPDGNARWIVIGPKGEVHGDIRAQNVSVAGKVFGNITASESIELLEGSAVRGNIVHKSINVEPGATLHGQLIGSENAPVEPAANQDQGPEITA